MPDDDLILNVRQVAGFPHAPYAVPSDELLFQRNGLGGPYYSIQAAQFVSTALAEPSAPLQVGIGAPGDAEPDQIFTPQISMPPLGAFMWNAYGAADSVGPVRLSTGSAAFFRYDQTNGWSFYNASAGAAGTEIVWQEQFNVSPTGYLTGVDQILLARDPAGPLEAATAQWVEAVVAGLQAATVWSFNGRRGDVRLWLGDITCAGGAPLFSPRFQGAPRAETPAPWSNGTRLATTGFVHRNSVEYISHLLRDHPFVFSFNGRTGDVTLQASDLAEADVAPLASPAFTGTPTAPTAPSGTDTDQLATTAFVNAALGGFDLSSFAPLASPAFSGYVTAPTPPFGSSDGQVATTAFVQAAIVESTTGVASFNGRTGAVVLEADDITTAGGALLASPVFTGVPTGPTAAPGTSSTQFATTAFVMAALAGGGVVTSFNTRVGAITLEASDIIAAGGAPIVSPALTGTPSAPTPAPGDNSTTLATTAYVTAALAAYGTLVSSFNGRTGAITLTANDVSAAGGAVLASPTFSGIPTAPTAALGTATSQIATTNFVMQALAGGAGVSSFNGRGGAVTLTAADLTAAGGALLASPAFTGAPSGPTPALGTSTTQLATTAFVMNELASAAVVSTFNGRGGAVTLTAADLSGAGGALLASPTFTGTPAAPTAILGTNTTQLATTAFVQAAVVAASAGVISFNGRDGAITLTANDISGAGGVLAAGPSTLSLANIVGTANGTAAPAGAVGEYQSNTVTSATLSGSWASIVSLTLTAGDWDVRGSALVFGAALGNVAFGLSTTPNVAPAGLLYSQFIGPSGGFGNTIGAPTPTMRLIAGASTVVYLNALGTAGSGAVTCNGLISARRMH